MKAALNPQFIAQVNEIFGDGVREPAYHKIAFAWQSKEFLNDEGCNFYKALAFDRFGLLPHYPLAMFILYNGTADLNGGLFFVDVLVFKSAYF